MKGGTGILKQRFGSGETSFCACVMDCTSGAVMEAYKDAGFDYVMIDREHTALNSETIREHIRTARILELPVVVRVAEASYAELNRTLDQLPDGIFVPRVRTREDVERIVEMVKYPPEGVRGLGASTCPAGKYLGWSSVAEQRERLNMDTVVGIQIETLEAFKDAENILAVAGIDVAVIGPDDLSVGMGIPGRLDHPDFIAAVDKVIAACRENGVCPGFATGNPEMIRFWAERGCRTFWCAADICLLWQGAVNAYKAAREAVRNANRQGVEG
jgi:2-keto-3-deoxy-L-rhamnonate aldolase RhmA